MPKKPHVSPRRSDADLLAAVLRQAKQNLEAEEARADDETLRGILDRIDQHE